MARPVVDKSGQIVKAEPNQLSTLVQRQDYLSKLIMRMEPQLVKALPKHISAQRIARIAMTAIRANAKLAECSPTSFLGSLLTCAQLGLEPNTPLGQAYLIPFKDTRTNTTNCQVIVGYQGMMDLVRRSGEVKNIRAYAVRQGDEFMQQMGTDAKIVHKPSDDENREERPITHVYSIATFKDGGIDFYVMSKRQIAKFRNRSKAKDSGPWQTDEEAMCLKTVVRRHFTWLPKSVELARAIAIDEAPEIGKAQEAEWDVEVSEVLASEGLSLPGTAVDPTTGEIVQPGASGAVSEGQDEGGMGLNDIAKQIAKITKQKPEEILKRIQAQAADPKTQKEIAGYMLDDAQAREDEEAAGKGQILKRRLF